MSNEGAPTTYQIFLDVSGRLGSHMPLSDIWQFDYLSDAPERVYCYGSYRVVIRACPHIGGWEWLVYRDGELRRAGMSPHGDYALDRAAREMDSLVSLERRMA